ncbi:site-specific recombinase XerD [Kineococcus xinjiangensis]|uniref:Site-specific recombinase XerD n=1 Tax=Kineococcus xinjiangensis TaxID=512762 RepID=A0A2S6IC94_9ACTN|nr:tyrosine-type recombinase/integrase [Kineococcus xinjiangensis]PPK90848.1 site-specific recombinase XerD [Kineococcus xinjiangensis]
MSGQRSIPGLTVYPRGKTWAYQVEGERHPLTGERQRKYKGGFPTEREAWTAGVDAQKRVNQGQVPHNRRIKVRDFLEQWLEATRPALKATTHANYRNMAEFYVYPTLGNRWLSDLSVQTLNAFYRHLSEQGRVRTDTGTAMYEMWTARRDERGGFGPLPSEIAAACGTSKAAARAATMRFRRGRVPTPTTPGLSPKSVKHVHALMRRALRDAVAWECLLSNPAAHAVLPRRRAETPVQRTAPWTVEELARWLRVALEDRYGGLWVLAATTGLRRSELAAVRRTRLDLEAQTLTVEDTRVVINGRVADSDGKTRSGRRMIALDDFTIKHLRAYLAGLDAEREAFGASYPDHDHVAVSPEGRCLSPDTFTRRFNRLVDRAGVPRIRLHDIRHTYATLAMDAGADPKTLSDRIGHANTSITMQVYTHRSTGKDRPLAERMSALIQAALDAEQDAVDAS